MNLLHCLLIGWNNFARKYLWIEDSSRLFNYKFILEVVIKAEPWCLKILLFKYLLNLHILIYYLLQLAPLIFSYEGVNFEGKMLEIIEIVWTILFLGFIEGWIAQFLEKIIANSTTNLNMLFLKISYFSYSKRIF